MIFTITFNPSIDYIIHVPSFESGIINRTDDEKILTKVGWFPAWYNAGRSRAAH